MSGSGGARGSADAGSVDVAIVGGGVAGLVAALDCARAGRSIVVIEAEEVAGGAVARIEPEGTGLVLDAGAESFATRGGAVGVLLVELGLGEAIVDPDPEGAWLLTPRHGLARAGRMPRTGVLGIPAHPLAPEVRRVIGWPGALRAALDRLRPLPREGPAPMLGPLVRSRQGSRVLDRLVTPISAGVYSADPEVLEVDAVAPGLRPAVREAGSLAGGVERLVAGRRAGTAVRGLDGGMHRLVDALVTELARLGGGVRTGVRATALARAGDGLRIETEAGPVRARAVVLAAPAASSLPLLARLAESPAALVAAEEWPTPASVDLVTLVVDAPALDAHPRGTGLLVARGTPGIDAKALTHASAKWPWLAARLPSGRHVLRLSYGRAGEPNPAEELDEAALAALALADASAMLGVELGPERLVGRAHVRWRDALSHAAAGQRDRVERLRAALDATPGVEATGAWVAGTGLASVVPHARATAARVLAELGG